jgi:transposase-like protein
MGTSFRSLGILMNRSGVAAYFHVQEVLKDLPHVADITRKYCTRFSGILLVDGKYVAVGGYDRKIPVLYGIDYDTHDIPTYILSKAENYQTCFSFFQSLRLLNYPLQAVVCDDNNNIYDAARAVYPNVVIQLCQNHYLEGIRNNLSVRIDRTYGVFMRELEHLFHQKRSPEEFLHVAGRLWKKYGVDPRAASVLLDINRRMDVLCGYMKLKHVPQTTNLIEAYNSHLQGRLKSLKGFESFTHADNWLNAYFLYRRLKKFTDCEKKFRHLNGYASLEKTMKNPSKFDDLLWLFR